MGTYAKVFETLLTSQRASGVTLSGGKVHFYVPGSVTTYKTIYADRGKQTPAANPYTLSSDGTASIYGDGLYDVILKTAAGATVTTWEDVSLVDIGGDETSIANYADLAAAVAAIGATKATMVIGTDQVVTADLTVPSTMALKMVNEAKITISSGKVLTINGPFDAPTVQALAGSGTVVFGLGYVERILTAWWGTNGAAWNAACTTARASRTTDIQTSIPVVVPNGSYTIVGPVLSYGVDIKGCDALVTHDNTNGKPLFHIVTTDTADIPYRRSSIQGFSFKSSNGAADCIRIGHTYAEEPDPLQFLGASNVEISNNSWNSYDGHAINIYKGESISIHHNSFHIGVGGNDIKTNGALEGTATGYYANMVTIRENRFSSHDRFTGGGTACMVLDGDTIKIENNIIIGSTHNAIVLGSLSSSYNISVTDNYFEQNGYAHVYAGLTSGTYYINGMEISGNRMFGGTTDAAMNYGIILNSVYGAGIRDNFLNNAPAGGGYLGYLNGAVFATPARCKNIEIVTNMVVDDDIATIIDPTVRTIPGLLFKHYGTSGEYVLDGTLPTETPAASLTPASTYDILASGTYQVDLVVKGNGVSLADNIAGSWLVLFYYNAAGSIESVQAIGTTAKVGAITSLVLAGAAAGSSLRLTATLTQTNNTTAQFDWRIKQLMPY